MKTCPWIVCLLFAFVYAGGVVVPARVEAQSQVPVPVGAPDELEQLVAPIALYPDALVAIILPASTASTDIVLAARYLDAGGDPNAVENQNWDESVKSLAHYPELVHWMNENLEWTEEMGSTYIDQPENVMAAIQRARARAMANGTLVTTSEQEVVIENGYIRIIPAQPNVIYIPRYDPEIIFVDQSPDFYPGPLITWGPAFGVGFWLSFDCDWGRRAIWCDPRPREHWNAHRDWRQREWGGPNRPVVASPGWHRWQPPPGRAARLRSYNHAGANRVVRRPVPPSGAPHFDRNRVRATGPVNEHARSAAPVRVAPRRPASGTYNRQAGPPAERQDRPVQGTRPADRGHEVRPDAVAPPQQHREEGHDQRYDQRADRRQTPGPATPPAVRTVPPPPVQPERPRPNVPAPATRRVEPSRPVQPRAAPPAHQAAPRAGPPARSAPPSTPNRNGNNSASGKNDRDHQ